MIGLTMLAHQIQEFYSVSKLKEKFRSMTGCPPKNIICTNIVLLHISIQLHKEWKHKIIKYKEIKKRD